MLILFLLIHQVEGHIVVPNVMGSALRLHPLLVIFGLLAGGEIYGLAGILVALPLLAAARAAYEFFSERVAARAVGNGRAGAVEVEVEPPPPPRRCRSPRRRPRREPPLPAGPRDVARLGSLPGGNHVSPHAFF